MCTCTRREIEIELYGDCSLILYDLVLTLNCCATPYSDRDGRYTYTKSTMGIEHFVGNRYELYRMYMYIHNVHTASFSFLKAVSSFTISLSFSNASVLYTYFPCRVNFHIHQLSQ